MNGNQTSIKRKNSISREKYTQMRQISENNRFDSDQARDGERLTSMTHGRRESSIKMSNPNSSVQQNHNKLNDRTHCQQDGRDSRHTYLTTSFTTN